MDDFKKNFVSLLEQHNEQIVPLMVENITSLIMKEVDQQMDSMRQQLRQA